MSMYPVTVVVEGDTDLPFAKAVLRAAGLEAGNVVDTGGKDRLDAQLSGFNAAARGSPWLVLRDLDRDAVCAPSLRAARLPDCAALMCFRIPVHAVEAWALGDFERIASFLKVSTGRLPLEPEKEIDPKQTLVNLARRSTKRAIREDLVPPEGGVRKVGPGYEARLIEFGTHHWRWRAAQRRCPSLRRSVEALRRLRATLSATR